MIDQQLYKKRGRKYISIGYSDGFTGFPSEGIWIVYNKPKHKCFKCIAFMGKFKDIDYSLLATLIKEKKDKCIRAYIKKYAESHSPSDIINIIFETLLTK